MTYDYVVVGSGLFGSVFAQQMREHGRSACVIERRDHIGGNCYSYDYQDTHINVHAYGTHIFHTNDEATWRYVRRFTEFNRYRHRVLTTFRSKVYSMPINLGTVNAFYGLNLRPWELAVFLAKQRGDIANPQNLEEKAISLVGRELYEATWRYVRRFTEFNRYRHRVLTTFRSKVYSMPINLGTVNAFYGLNLRPWELAVFLAKQRGDIANPQNLEEKAISLVGRELY